MPRSGGGGGGRSGGMGSAGGRSRSSFGSPPSRSYSTGRPTPPPTNPSPKPAAGVPGQPSLFKQAAATAMGVAAGSVLASAILGSGRDSIPAGVDCSDKNCRIPDDDPCAVELRNFIDCAYGANEITQCDGFNTLLKECRRYIERKSSS